MISRFSEYFFENNSFQLQKYQRFPYHARKPLFFFLPLRISLFEIGKTPFRFRNYPFEKLQIVPTFADVKEIQSQCLTFKYRRYDYEENDVPGNDDGDDHHGQRNEL